MNVCLLILIYYYLILLYSGKVQLQLENLTAEKTHIDIGSYNFASYIKQREPARSSIKYVKSFINLGN